VSPALFNDCDNDNNALIATDRDQALGTPACSSSHNSGSGHGHDAPQPYSESVYRRDLEGARVAMSIATRPLGTPVFYILFLLSNYSLQADVIAAIQLYPHRTRSRGTSTTNRSTSVHW